jgi:hypothetical protein
VSDFTATATTSGMVRYVCAIHPQETRRHEPGSPGGPKTSGPAERKCQGTVSTFQKNILG